MLKDILLIPFIITIFGFFIQFNVLAHSTSVKVLHYADDMNNALDCAFRAKDISLCSPDIKNYDFSKEVNDFNNLNNELINYLESFGVFNITNNETVNLTYNPDNQTVIINTTNATYIIVIKRLSENEWA